MDSGKLRTHEHPLTLKAGQSECYACSFHTKTDHYVCLTCKNVCFHKECITLYTEITHPYHPIHPLQICTNKYPDAMENCVWCNRYMGNIFYRCSICKWNIHLFCASQPQLVLTLENKKDHDHPLTIFPRRMYFTCNLCGCCGDWFPIYACVQCDFMVHRGCLGRVIRISCHEHRISRGLYLPLGKWFYGFCRSGVDARYGAFFCTKKDCGYAAHTNCAVLDDVWDKRELEHVPEDQDELKDVEPYEVIDDNLIKHFSHDHNLRFILNLDGDKTRSRCQACNLLIQYDNLYKCNHCNFILHQDCANFKRMRWHPLHPHPVTLKADDDMEFQFPNSGRRGFYFCSICARFSCGFRYVCEQQEFLQFEIDVRCASMPQELNHKNHPHTLFIRLINRKTSLPCGSCGKASNFVFNCLQCPNYIMCFECATLPDNVAYKHDQHPLILCCGENEKEDAKGGQYWCETCEKKLDPKQWFYKCEDCSVILHIPCLLGSSPYAKPGPIMIKAGRNGEEFERIHHFPPPGVLAEPYFEKIPIRSWEEFDIIANETLSRPVCCRCDRPCQDSVAFKQERDFYGSLVCLGNRKSYNDPHIFPEKIERLFRVSDTYTKL